MRALSTAFMILPAGCWSAQTPKEPAAGAAAAAGTVFFAINGAILKTFLCNTVVGRIAIVEISCAIVACIPFVVAWITLKKSSSSNLALLAAAGIAAVGLPFFLSTAIRLDQQIAGLLASIAHRLALADWAGGLPALIMLIGAGPFPDDTRRLAACVL
jgi:putative copper export protein